jgi:hypothetical protein
MPLGKIAVFPIVVMKKSPETYSCKDFSHELNAPACRIFLHLFQGMRDVPDTRGSSFDFRFLLDFTQPIAPRYAGYKCLRAFAENERGDSLSMQHDVGDDFEGDDSKGC